MTDRYPLPVDKDNINLSSDYFRLQAALAYIAFLSREGIEITLEAILAFLKEFNSFFETVDSDAEKKEKQQEEERKKMQEEISKNLKIYRQVLAQFTSQHEETAEIMRELAVEVRVISIEESEELVEEMEEGIIKELK